MLTAPPSRLQPLRTPRYSFALLVFCLCIFPPLILGFGGPCRGRPILLPVTGNPPPSSSVRPVLEISLQSDYAMFLESKWYSTPDLPRMCRSVALSVRSHPDTQVVLKIDRTCQFAAVRSIMHGLSSHGIRTITLRTERSEVSPILPGA